MILAASFPDIVSSALKTFVVKDNEPKASVSHDGSGKSEHAHKTQPAAKLDKALLAVMRANLGASLADLIRLGRRARTSTVTSLKDLVEHPTKDVYRVVDQAPRPPASAWVEPLSGAHVARHAADGRVPDARRRNEKSQ